MHEQSETSCVKIVRLGRFYHIMCFLRTLTYLNAYGRLYYDKG